MVLFGIADKWSKSLTLRIKRLHAKMILLGIKGGVILNIFMASMFYEIILNMQA